VAKRLFARKSALTFIVMLYIEKEKLALSNFEDLERKRKMLPQILLSTIVCMHTNARSKTTSSQNAKSKTVYAGLSLHITFALANEFKS